MLLPFRYKKAGYAVSAAGLLMSALFFSVDFRIEIPVLALVSSYMETKFFSVFTTNFSDEIIVLTLLAGFLLIIFTKEKKEEELPAGLRLKAAGRAVIFNSALLTFATIFIYGAGFMTILEINLFSPLVLYILFFSLLKRKLSSGRK